MKNLNEYFDKIYCINLEQDTNKLIYFDQEITKSQLLHSYTKFSAVDGSKIDLSEIDYSTISDKARESVESQSQKIFGISLTFGSLGCALSHKKIFEECQNNNKPYLIFEDDIVVEKKFDYVLEQILDRNIDYDILYLGYNEIPGFYKNKIDDLISTPHGLITGLYGYMLSPNGANKLLSTIFPLDKQIDSSISDNRDKLNLYCTTDRILGVTHKFGSKTQQNNSCKNIHIKSLDDWHKLFK